MFRAPEGSRFRQRQIVREARGVAYVVPLVNLSAGEVSDYVSLTDVALRRKSEPAGGLYIAESSKVIRRALSAGHQPRSVLTAEKWREDMVQLFDAHDIPIYLGSDAEVEAMTGFHLHRGALAAMNRPPQLTPEDVLKDARLVIVLENLVDHTNVGAIFRAVAGMGADAVLVTPACADPLYRRSIRVSMGTVLQVPWARFTSWPSGIDVLRANDFHVAALALDEHAVDLRDFASSRPNRVALVVGAEGDGLAPSTVNAVDSVVRIPMRQGVDSLNVASAAAVALYALT
jgi:tRNA G18 (ribose-2'-O)-methylase SpoU